MSLPTKKRKRRDSKIYIIIIRLKYQLMGVDEFKT